MRPIASNLTELIGSTPLLSISRYAAANGLGKSRITAKLEYFNPLGSSKDRIGIAMIEDAESRGILRLGDTIIEPTSGNTGIALAFACAVRGYKLILTMPETMSVERRQLLKQLGATLELTKGSEGMDGAVRRAEELKAQLGGWIPQQFENPANPQAHYNTTGQEIWDDTEGTVDIFIAGVGTGGTLHGVGKALKEKNPNVCVIAVEPKKSPVLSGGEPSPHGIQGIGANFVPGNFSREYCDEVMQVGDEEAMVCARQLARTEGLLVGISSGAAACAALRVAARPSFEGKHIVVLLPDTGERYLSSQLFPKDD